jgi:putative glutamine amidotransferase
MALVGAAAAAGLPVLGICRGLQVLNVAAGGSLVQHLPPPSYEVHRRYEPDREPVHQVEVQPASLLADVTGELAWGVNSLHHQAVAAVGRGLRPTAWAPDGVIEALEGTGASPVLGVQWHPELITHERPQALVFAWLAAAAASRRSGQAAQGPGRGGQGR